MRHKLFFLIFFLNTAGFQLYSQDGEVSLAEVLPELEKRHDISFSYESKTVAEVRCDAPDYSLKLDDILTALSEQTGLEFFRINERFIGIRKPAAETTSHIKFCGTVRDSVSGEPIPYAVVFTPEEQSVTNESGFFEITVEKGTAYTIQVLGYNRYSSLAENNSECPDIYLSRSVMTLEEIVIRDFLVSGVDLTATGNFELSTRQLGTLPGLLEPDVLQTIQTLPGIQSVQESVSDINVRGGTNAENLVLYEGIRMYLTGHFFGLISSINPYTTDKVRLIQHGTPVQYSDAVSGTMDIRTDNQIPAKFGGSGGINMINADLNIHLPIIPDKLSVLVAGRRSIADIVETPTYGSYFDRAFQNSDLEETSSGFRSNEEFNFNEFYAKVMANPGDDIQVRANFFSNSNELSYEEEALIAGNTESRSSGLVQKSIGANIAMNADVSEDITLSGQVYYSSYSLSAVNNDLFNDQRLIQENEVQDNGLQLDIEQRFGNKFSLHSGYQFSEKGISNLEEINNPPFKRLVKRVLRIHSAYTEGIYQSRNQRTQIRTGVRMQYLEKFKRIIAEPRLSFRQGIWKNIFAELSFEKKSQTVAQVIDFQTDFLGIEKRRWLLANESDIPVAISYQISGGLQYSNTAMVARASVYARQVEGVSTASQGFQNEIQFNRTVGEYEVKGLDVFLKWRRDRLHLFAAYSLAENIFSSDSLATFPNTMDIRHTLSTGIAFDSKRVNGSTGITWHTGRPYSRAIGVGPANTIIYEETNISRLDDYFRWDANLIYKFRLFPGLRAEAGVSVWNILNRENISNIFYRLDGNNEIQEIKQRALGITPNAMFRVYF